MYFELQLSKQTNRIHMKIQNNISFAEKMYVLLGIGYCLDNHVPHSKYVETKNLYISVSIFYCIWLIPVAIHINPILGIL